MYKYGLSGPHPCDAKTRWRKFAFTKKDRYMSQVNVSPSNSGLWPMTKHNVTLDTRSGKKVWLYAQHVRTVTAEAKWHNDDGTATADDVADGVYQVCASSEYLASRITGDMNRYLYGRFSLKDPNPPYGCRYVGGNPEVDLDVNILGEANGGLEGELDPLILDFSAMAGVSDTDFLDIGYNPTAEPGDSGDDTVKL